MTEDSDFSLISVDADEEDDVVIQAGAAQQANRADRTAASAVQEHGSEPAETEAEPDRQAAAERAARERAVAKRKAEEDMNRMVTTEEDLHAPVPYAHMQRTILIILAIAIVLFLVYYFVAFKPLG